MIVIVVMVSESSQCVGEVNSRARNSCAAEVCWVAESSFKELFQHRERALL
jgi:hypothetical protein